MIEKAQREAAQRKEKENVLQGAGIAITRKNDKNKKEATVSITLDKGQKAEFLEKAEKYLVSQIKDFLKNEGKDLHEVKKAVEQYEKNPNAETAARVAEAYEKTAVAIGAGFTPIAGDVIDGFIALKDVYRGDYLSAGISTAAMFTPFLPATVAKKISKAIFETPLGKKIADSSFGKWAIARFGKKADEVGEQAANGGDLAKSLDDIPTNSNGFNKWFDSQSPENLQKYYQDPKMKNKIENQLRGDGGNHEFLMVVEAPHWKKWGATANQVKDDFAVSIKELNEKLAKNWKHSTGVKGNTAPGSKKAHNELQKIIKNSDNFNQFKYNIKDWADKYLRRGYDDLPKGFR